MATTSLVSVAQLRELPEPTDGTYHELHGGEVVRLTIPKKRHQRLQRHLRRLLEPLAAPYGIVELEIGFRLLPEYEARRADVAFVSQARWDADEDDLMGAPEMVIEVLSPSNTVTEIDEKRSLCLAHGCREFWVVDAQREAVSVTTHAGTRLYRRGADVPLAMFGATLAVDVIFG